MFTFLTNGTVLTCSFGGAPCPLVVLDATVTHKDQAVANILDHTLDNVPSFGMCTSPENPAVIAQAGAPAPCVPVIMTPWSPGVQNVSVRQMPTIDKTCQLTCAFSGVITAVSSD
jgi:Domain of unknown function (DUF4280)